MKKILLIHDVFSSINDIFIKDFIGNLRKYLIIVPELPTQPAETMRMLKAICKEENPDLVVGWNSGGFFAQQLSDYERVLISPEYDISVIFNSILKGKNGVDFPYIVPRSSGEERFDITPALVKSYAEMEARQFSNISRSKKMVHSFFWFGHNERNLKTHQEHYHDVTFLPGKDYSDPKSTKAICSYVQFLLDNPEI